MPAPIDIVGHRFGRLVALERQPKSKWRCRCDCGGESSVVITSLRKGHTRSCGCLKVEVTVRRSRTHGKSRSRLYNIWCLMRSRCNRASGPDFLLYGGRGIRVCSEWCDFESFARWARSSGYRSHLSIDRIDNDGNYEPSNCRWATAKEQGRNNRMGRRITLNGHSACVSEHAERERVSYFSVARRTRDGVAPEQAIADIRAKE